MFLWSYYIIIFIFGTIIGSFLSSVSFRLNKTFSLEVKKHSFCPKCLHRLGFFDLIPLVSFILLKGKCRYCGEKISLRYPLIEAGTGIVFAVCLLFISAQNIFLIGSWHSFAALLYLLLTSSFLIVVLVADLEQGLIPSNFVYGAVGISFLYKAVFNLRQPDIFLKTPNLFYSLLGGLGVFAFFFALWLVSKRKWIGFGDVELALFIGFFLGPTKAFLGLFCAFILGALIGLALKKKMSDKIPFAPFLITGFFIAAFLGDKITSWYFNLFF